MRLLGWVTIILAFVLVGLATNLGCDGGGGGAQVISTPPAPSTQRVCRFGATIPAGWIVTDYASDFAQCPDPPGYQTVYTVLIIQNYGIMKIGDVLSICVGQAVPAGWTNVGPNTNLTVCPREPGDPTQGPTAYYIKRLT